MKQLVIFDLDGTLLNTIGDLCASCNTILERHNLPTYDMDTYRSFVGSGIMRLVEQIIPEELRTKEFVAELRAEFLEYYYENISTYSTIYPEIEHLLVALKKRDVAVAVASNKFQDGSRKLISHFFPKIDFDVVFGQRPGVELKPNPQILRDIMQVTSYSADKVLFVGDSGIDIDTARAAGVESVGVTWGFRSREELEASGADHIVDSPKEILRLVE